MSEHVSKEMPFSKQEWNGGFGRHCDAFKFNGSLPSSEPGDFAG